MNILETYDKYTQKSKNALNDRSLYTLQTFKLNTDTHLVFKYDVVFGKWLYTPMKTYAHADFPADNFTIVVDVRCPEKEGFVAQPILKDITEPEFAHRILNAIEWVYNKCPPPACLENYHKAVAERKRR